MKIAVACGGTGGHIFPGLATANTLQARGHEVTLWLSGRDTEDTVKNDWEGEVVSVPARGFASSLSWSTVGRGLGLLKACAASYVILRRSRPDVLLAMGSYASVGPVVAAALCRIPVVLHEANAVPGRAVTFLSRFAAQVGVTFGEAETHFRAGKCTQTGQPLRAESLEGSDTANHEPPRRLLIMGGSLGAERLNEQISLGVCRLHKGGLNLPVFHLCGAKDAQRMSERYAQSGVDAIVRGFLSDMRQAYESCWFAIARAGAASCMELAAWGIPTLFVPLPEARRDHQAANARVFVEAGGADALDQSDLSPEWVASYLESLLADEDKVRRMRALLQPLAIRDGAQRLADLVELIANQKTTS